MLAQPRIRLSLLTPFAFDTFLTPKDELEMHNHKGMKFASKAGDLTSCILAALAGVIMILAGCQAIRTVGPWTRETEVPALGSLAWSCPSPTPIPSPPASQFPIAFSTSTPVPMSPLELPSPIILPTPSRPTLPPSDASTPVSEWITFREPRFGFSFQYPANWRTELPTGTPSASSGDRAWVVIRNMSEGRRVSLADIQITISVGPDLCGYTSLDDYLSKEGIFLHSSISRVEHLTISGWPAIRRTFIHQAPWMQIEGLSVNGATEVLIGKGAWLYRISIIPLGSTQMPAFDRLLSSLLIS